MDIDLCADTNSAKWQTSADDLVDRSPGASPFRTLCDGAQIGTDVIGQKLLRYLEDGFIDSTYEFRATSMSTTVAFATTYADGIWGPRRLAFETTLDCVRKAVYATLDLPGALGNPTYGPFRIVRDPDPLGSAPIVLPHNSASGYAPMATTDETKLCEDAGRWEDRGSIATTLKGERAAANPLLECHRSL